MGEVLFVIKQTFPFPDWLILRLSGLKEGRSCRGKRPLRIQILVFTDSAKNLANLSSQFVVSAHGRSESGKGLLLGGVKLPLALAELGLIDEYEFVVQPRLVGHGPTLFAGLSKRVDLKLVSRLEFGSGAVAMRYEPRR
jgi:dihydrofolate reductase